MTKEEAIRHFEMYINNDCYTIEHQQACRMAISAIHNQPVWIPVAERLPEVGKNVLVYSEFDGVSVDYHGGDSFGYALVTHWMPLPEPPKGD